MKSPSVFAFLFPLTAACPGQSLTTSIIGIPAFAGTTMAITARATSTSGNGAIQSLGIYAKPTAAGETFHFAGLADFVANEFWVFDYAITGNGSWPRKSLALCNGTTLSDPPTISGLTISSCTLSKSGNNVDLSMTFTRNLSMWQAHEEIVLGAGDGVNYSTPWTQSLVATWDAASTCPPISTSITSTTSAYTLPPNVSLPVPGASYCDPTFGNQVLRLTPDGTFTTDENLQVGFNSNSTRLIVHDASNGIQYLADFNPLTFTSSGQVAQLVPKIASTALGTGTLFWSPTDPNILFMCADGIGNAVVNDLKALKVYRIDLNADPNNNTTVIADLSSLFADPTSGPAPDNPKQYGSPYLWRCSMSRNGTTFGCAIKVRPPAEAPTFSVGYVVFKLISMTGPPLNNWTKQTAFINGIDSSSKNVFQSFYFPGTPAKFYFPITSLTSEYKFRVDRSGQYAVFTSARCTVGADVPCDSSTVQITGAEALHSTTHRPTLQS